MKRLKMFRFGLEFGYAPKRITTDAMRWKLAIHIGRWSKTWGSA